MNTSIKKYGKTIIDHNIRIKLRLTCAQYIFLDCLYNTKKMTHSFTDIIGLSFDEAKKIYESLSQSKLITIKTIGKESFLETTELWNENFKQPNIIVDVIEYLNKVTGSNYKTTSKGTLKLIEARLKEDYVLDDFKMVIDNRNKEWSNDESMKEYLRPETLFSGKFESYLEFAKKNKPKIIANPKMSGMQM